jgi:Neurotransmitter-gated ion-channel ligand binding domain
VLCLLSVAAALMTTLLLLTSCRLSNGDDEEYRLMRHLLRNYDRRVRPSLNASESLNVTFGLALAQIIDVVSKPDENVNVAIGSAAICWMHAVEEAGGIQDAH